MARRLTFPDDIRPDFPGFGPGAFRFLGGLARHNDRAWFEAHREAYETELRLPMECLVGAFAAGRAGAALPVRGDPRRGVFRIHRDVRFAKDKRPYKTHVGAILSRGGGRGEAGVVYIHIEPGGCFLGGGFYRPDPPLLGAWRRRMADDPDAFLAVVRAVTRGRDAALLESHETLSRLPRGYTDRGDSPVAAYLRWKHFLAHRPVSEAEAGGPGLVEIVRRFAVKSAPLLAYGWALADAAPDDDPRRHLATRRP